MILYLPIAHLLPLNVGRALLAGALLGYIGYDLTHYYLHHGSPTPGTYFASLKTYHVAHHYVNYNRGLLYNHVCNARSYCIVEHNVIEIRGFAPPPPPPPPPHTHTHTHTHTFVCFPSLSAVHGQATFLQACVPNLLNCKKQTKPSCPLEGLASFSCSFDVSFFQVWQLPFMFVCLLE